MKFLLFLRSKVHRVVAQMYQSLILLELKRKLRQLHRLPQGETLSVTPLLRECPLPGPLMARGEAVVDEVVPVAVVVPVAAVVLEVQDLHRQIRQRILLRQNILRRTKRRRAKGVILMMTDHLLCALIPTLRTMLIHGVVGTEGLLQLASSCSSDEDSNGIPRRRKPLAFDDLFKMLRSSNSKKSREAETVKISAIPENPVKFKAWKSDVRAQIAASSGKADKGLVWALEIERESATFASLQDSGKFPTLDVKLSAALTKLAHGDLGREIALQQEHAAKDGRLLRGRQALFMIYQHFKPAEEAGALYDLVDLTKVLSTTSGGKQIDLTTFLQNWEAVLAGMKVEPDISVKETLFKEQIKTD